MDDYFIANYATTSNIALAAHYGRSKITIMKWAGRLGLRKTPEYRSTVQRKNATGQLKSAETRAKIAAKARGRTASPETKAKALRTKEANGTLLRGAACPWWKGGKPWQRFKDSRYQDWRKAVLERDRYICQHCQRVCKKRERGLAAHHVKPYAEYPELRYVVDNGLTLCRACHMAHHRKPLPPVETAPCACGCGKSMPTRDVYGRARRYINGHAARLPRRRTR